MKLYILKFVIIYIAVASLTRLQPITFFFNKQLPNIVASHSAFLLQIFHKTIYSKGGTICGGNYNMTVAESCTCYGMLLVYLAGVIAFPSSVSKKVSGILYGIIIIHFLNVIRICLLFFAGIYNQNIFDLIHSNFAQTFFVFVMCVLWFFWIQKIEKESSKL